jgi:ABC-type amino acid transport substrate-binding protein
MLAFVLAACGGSKGGITSPDDFPGHNIAVKIATTASDSIDEMIEGGAKKIEVSRYEKVTQCFDDLALDRVDAVYVDSVVSAYYTAGSDKYNRVWLSDATEPMGVCLAKSAGPLAAAVEAALDTMYFDGTMAGIATKNFGEDFTAGLRDVKEAPVIPTDFTTMAPGKLIIGCDVGYPPMEYKADNGVDFVGFDIDVAARVAELLGLEAEYVNTAWDGIFTGLENGRYDAIVSAVSITPERQEKYILTRPYVANALCIVTKAAE